MKKIIVFILIFTMLFIINAYASEINQDIINEYNSLLQIYNNVLMTESEVYIEVFSSNSELSVKLDSGYYQLWPSGTFYVSRWNKIDLNFDYMRMEKTNISNYWNSYRQSGFLYSNYDIKYKDSSTVFFSQHLPPEIPILTQMMMMNPGGILEGVRPLIPVVMTLVVGSVGLWKGWFLLKTSLLGA